MKKNKLTYIIVAVVVVLLAIAVSIWLMASNNTKKAEDTVALQCRIISTNDIKSSLGTIAENIQPGVASEVEKGTSDQTQKVCSYTLGTVSGTELKFALRLRDYEAKFTSEGHYNYNDSAFKTDRTTELGDGTTFVQYSSGNITNSAFTVYKFKTTSRAFEFALDTKTDGDVKPEGVKALLVDLANKINFDSFAGEN